MRIAFIARRNLKRHPGNTIKNSIAVAIATSVILFLFGLMGGIEKDLQYTITHYLSGDIRIQNREYQENVVFNPSYFLVEETEKIEGILSQTPQVEAISKKLNVPIAFIRDELFEPLLLQGIDFQEEQRYSNILDFIVEGRAPQDGAREALVGTSTAEHYNFRLHDKITFLGSTANRGQNGMTLEIVGFIEYPVPLLHKQKLFTSLKTAQKFFQSPNAVTEIGVRAIDGTNEKELLRTVDEKLVAAQLVTPLLIEPWQGVNSFVNIIRLGRVIYIIIGLVFFILGSLVLYNTVLLSLLNRRFEMGVLNAMGFSKAMLKAMFKFEVFYTVILGVVLGMILGNTIILLLGTFGLNMASFDNWDDSSIMSLIQYPQLSIVWNMVIFFYSLIVCYIIGILPLLKLRKETTLSLLKSN